MKLDELKRKRVLILGFGREGKDNFIFLRGLFPQKVLGIADRDENARRKIKDRRLFKKARWHLGRNYLNVLPKYDLIIKSPGIPVHLPEIERAFKKGKITSQTEIFFENYQGKIVGITGTKGKSTTSSLIFRILKEGGLKARLTGNIGRPVLSLLTKKVDQKEVCVYELSSHQLYTLKKSPNLAIFLNIYPEHLDYYKSFKEYLRAKQNITRYQKKEDYFIFNPKNIYCRETAKISRAKKIPIDIKKIGKIIKIKDVPLMGEFNLLNVAAAIEVAKIFEIKKEKMAQALRKFKSLPHRLEFVGNFKGIKFYNDSLSTIPESTIYALDALGNNVQTIFLGGFERNLDFTKLAKRILKSSIKNVILFPVTGERIWKKILSFQKKRKGLPRHFYVEEMAEAVKLSYQNTKKGKICLLSCASPSFGTFKDYKERGNLFKKYVKIFAKNYKRICQK